MKYSILARIKELYEKENRNIMEYLKGTSNSEKNSIEDILISYDFQAGTYTNSYKSFPYLRDATAQKIAQYINNLGEIESLVDIGVGEATTLGLVLKNLKQQPQTIKGLDLSWSRIKYAKQFLSEQQIQGVDLAVGDMFDIPLCDHSVDLVFTFQAIEPNGGNEAKALQELYRISKKYLVLVEPCYEIAHEEAKKRMESNGYIKGLYNTAITLGYNVVLHEPLGVNLNDLNPVAILIIEKTAVSQNSSAWSCPLTKSILQKKQSCYYSTESLLAYPIIEEIPCLLPSNAIVATKM